MAATTPGFAEAVARRAEVLAGAQRELDDARQRGGMTFMTAEEMRRVFDSGDLDQKRAVLREWLPGGAIVIRGRGLQVDKRIKVVT